MVEADLFLASDGQLLQGVIEGAATARVRQASSGSKLPKAVVVVVVVVVVAAEADWLIL